MDLQALSARLDAEGFRPDSYEFGGAKHLSETYVLEERDGVWVTFYAERGLERSLATFARLEAAAEDLLRRLDGDPLTRRE